MRCTAVVCFGLCLLTACDHDATTLDAKSAAPSSSASASGDTPVNAAGDSDVAAASTDLPPFQDRATELGIDFQYSNGRDAGEYAILESLGGGVAILDFDHDGWDDLYFPGGGTLHGRFVGTVPGRLYQNREGRGFVDRTSTADAAANAFYTHGAYYADFDNDGWADLAVSGYGGIQLLRNMGDGTFLLHAVLQCNCRPDWSTSLAWFDADGDGDLDLYAAHYVDWSWDNHPVCTTPGGRQREVCAPREFAGLPDALWVNSGTGEFVNQARALGLRNDGKGLGVVALDVNGDRRMDVYVANDTVDNFLYVQNDSGTFEETAVVAGVAGDEFGVSTGSMGIAVLDANLDKLPDILVTNFERELPALYRNSGNGLFTYASRQMGLARLHAVYVGFGCVPVDFDFDGDEDIVIANGHVSYHSPHAPYRQNALLLESEGGREFVRLMPAGYFSQAVTGRGVAAGDLDHNGGQDIVISHLEDPVAVLMRTSRPPARWAMVRLVGVRSVRDGIGATVRIRVGGREQVRWIVGGGSYLSSGSRHIPIYCPEGASEPAVFEVIWPNGGQDRWEISGGGEWTLIEGVSAALRT